MACPDCFSGAVHAGAPTGRVVPQLHGLDTYVAEPASGAPPRGIVLLLPDAFGWDFVNVRLLADNFARKRDYRVYVPDFMNGHSTPLWLLDEVKFMGRAKTWKDKLATPYHLFWAICGFATFLYHNRFGPAHALVTNWLSALRAAEAAHLPVGAAGYCWGGKLVVMLAGDPLPQSPASPNGTTKPLIDAGFTAHPSRLAFYADIEALRVPVSFAVPEHDGQMSVAQAERTREIVEGKGEGEGKGEVKVYKGCGHGFATRCDQGEGDGDAARAAEAAEEAEDQALSWFERHFAGVEY